MSSTAPKPQLKTIADMWSIYSGHVMPPDAPAIQRSEMKRAFYAGVHSLMREMLGPLAELDEEAGADRMQKLYNEAIAFI